MTNGSDSGRKGLTSAEVDPEQPTPIISDASPAGTPERIDNVEEDRNGDDEEAGAVAEEDQEQDDYEASDRTPEELVEARPVMDHVRSVRTRRISASHDHQNDPACDLVEAEPLEGNDIVRRFLGENWGCWLLVAVLMGGSIAIILGIVFGVGTQDNTAEQVPIVIDFAASPGTGNPPPNTSSVSAANPTAPPSRDSLTPTMAPSIEFTFDLLPNATQIRIQDSRSSAQAKAWAWLSEDPKSIPFTRKQTRFALATFYYSTDGDFWTNSTNWLKHEEHECDWFINPDWYPEGSCPNGDGALVHLEIPRNNLGGTLPPEIALLPNTLVTLALYGNLLDGSIPTELGTMTQLKVLRFWSCHFTGTIPTELAGLTDLVGMEIDDNVLTGTIPRELHSLPLLEKMHIFSNQLTGTLHTEMGYLTKMGDMRFDSNLFHGTIPSEFGAMTSLFRVKFEDNGFTGTFPTEIGFLTLLQEWKWDRNRMTGALPSEMGLLTLMREIRVYENRFQNSSLPTELGLMTSVSEMRLDSAMFLGTLPSELGRLSLLTNLRLNGNLLTGSIVSELGNLDLLQDLQLQSQRLSGVIPSELGLLKSLENLDLSNNLLSGEIPTEVLDLEFLATLNLEGNPNLWGVVPQEYCVENNGKISLKVDCANVTCGCCTCNVSKT